MLKVLLFFRWKRRRARNIRLITPHIVAGDARELASGYTDLHVGGNPGSSLHSADIYDSVNGCVSFSRGNTN